MPPNPPMPMPPKGLNPKSPKSSSSDPKPAFPPFLPPAGNPPNPPPLCWKNILNISLGSMFIPEVDILKVLPGMLENPENPGPPMSKPSPSKSIPPISYLFLFYLSDKQAQASATSLNFLVASYFSASHLSLFRSGWYFSANFLQAFLISSSVAYLLTPRIAQQSFFLLVFYFFLAYSMSGFRLAVGSSCQILLQSLIAAVQSYFSMQTSPLLLRDLVQLGLSSNDLFRSFSALLFSFLFINVNALFEQIIELSFLLKGSKLMASVYFASASANLFALTSQFPSYFSLQQVLALTKQSLHLAWSGASCRPSVKCFLALALSPPQSSMIPRRQKRSGSFELGIVLSMVSASSVAPVLARASILNILRALDSGNLLDRQATHESASAKSLLFSAC